MAVAQKGKRWLKHLRRSLLTGLLSLMLLGCANSRSVRVVTLPDVPVVKVGRLSGPISEVAPPAVFLDLADLMGAARPEVAIAYPEPDQVIEATQLTAKLTLRDLSIYKDETTALGPHLQVILDNQPAQSIYSLDDPLEFSDLSPGSHTLRVFAVRPWGESFKNEAAFAQTTFHVFAKTGANVPDLTQPLLTYSEPQGTYGAEPILLDFYLTNAPLHLLAQESPKDDISDWRVRCTVNGQSFVFEQWQPVYLKGFKPGQNWVQLALIDEQGRPIDNAFNSTVRLVNYDPEQQDSLAKIVRGELRLKEIGQIADPSYEPPSEPTAPPEPAPIEIIEPELQPEEPLTAPEAKFLEPESEPEVDQSEDIPAETRLPEAEPADSARLREPTDNQIDELSDGTEGFDPFAEEKPSQLPDELSDLKSTKDLPIETPEESEEFMRRLEEAAVERSEENLIDSEPAPPIEVPKTLTSPDADDAPADTGF